MSGKRKVRIEQVVEIAKRCSQGGFSINSISRKLGLNYETVRESRRILPDEKVG